MLHSRYHKFLVTLVKNYGRARRFQSLVDKPHFYLVTSRKFRRVNVFPQQGSLTFLLYFLFLCTFAEDQQIFHEHCSLSLNACISWLAYVLHSLWCIASSFQANAFILKCLLTDDLCNRAYASFWKAMRIWACFQNLYLEQEFRVPDWLDF